jgi:hypothetical protein
MAQDSAGGWEVDPFDIFADSGETTKDKAVIYKDFVVFLVDCRQNMSLPTPKGQVRGTRSTSH